MSRFASSISGCALAALAALAFGGGVAAAAAPAKKSLVDRGARIARVNCGGCHAVGAAGESPNPKSPPFRELGRRYPLSNLEEALGEGIVVGHEGSEMPPFRFNAEQIDALLAYLGAIQKR